MMKFMNGEESQLMTFWFEIPSEDDLMDVLM